MEWVKREHNQCGIPVWGWIEGVFVVGLIKGVLDLINSTWAHTDF